MIIDTTGKITEHLYLLGHPAVPVFLLDGDHPVIFDAGFTSLGEMYVNDIKKILGKRTPEICFLTHVHFDHCGSIPILKQHFSNLKVAASLKAKSIISRPNAVSLIRELNNAGKKALKSYGIDNHTAGIFNGFNIDMVLDHGDVFKVSKSLTIQILHTPGHTWDCLSYYVPERKILISSEAGGQIDRTGHIVSDCLADYDLYLKSLKTLCSLNVEVLCPGHISVYTGKDAKRYMTDSLRECKRFRRLVETCLYEESGDLKRVKNRIKAIEYDTNPGPKQPEPAYTINLEARILAVQKQMNSN